MLRELSQLANILRNAKGITDRFEAIAAQLKEERITGQAGAGLVKVEVNGLAEPLRVSIEPALLNPEEKELLEELLAGAMRDAIQKARARHMEIMTDLTGGLPIPGLDAFTKMFSGGA